jgi:hypothetical protein
MKTLETILTYAGHTIHLLLLVFCPIYFLGCLAGGTVFFGLGLDEDEE